MITLGVRDLASAVEFYETGLGFPRMESPPEVAFFALNGTWLGLYGREALADDAQVAEMQCRTYMALVKVIIIYISSHITSCCDNFLTKNID